MSAAVLPLLAGRDLAAPLAWRAGVPISGHAFLADAARQAACLPAHGPAINLCGDRYSFAVGLAAALLRGQSSLLPPDARPDTLARLTGSGVQPYALVDDATVPTGDIPRVRVEAAGTAMAPSGGAGEVPSIPAAQLAATLLTSGSTGLPQPHPKRWETLVGDVAAAVPRLAALLQRPSLAGLTLVATVPVQHSYGLESSALLALLGGAAFDSGRPFFPADIAKALASVPRPRALVTTPFHLKTLLLSGIALPATDLILSATAPLSPQLAAQAEAALVGVLVEIYGSTETGQLAWRRTTAGDIWETFGQVRMRAEPGAEGGERFVFEGDFVPEPTPMADVLELLDAQRFRLLGRANDLIHVAGRRSSLAHLNYHLNSIPGVQDGAFWLPDDVADGVVRTIAFVVAPAMDAAAVIAALRQRVEAVFLPRRVIHVTALPREGTGKLTAKALREFALARLGRAPAAPAVQAGPTAATVDGPVQLSLQVPVDHPVFEGHFPGQPLLPGALLLAEVLQAAQAVPALAARLGARPTLASAKFTAPVRPGSRLALTLQPETGAAGGLRFEVHAGGALAASGRWLPTPEDEA